jgi:predicted permease
MDERFTNSERLTAGGTIMLQNTLRITLRNIRKHRAISIINISGLALGIACCLLLLMWVQDEQGYDRFHEKHESIYRVIGKNFNNQGVGYSVTHPAPIGPKVQEKSPDVLEYVRIYSRNNLIQHKEKGFYLRQAIADPALFTLFTFPLMEGDAGHALDSPYSVVLTQSTASKMFGDEDPMGKTVKLGDMGDYNDVTVTGVMRDVPENSHLTFDFVLPLSLYEKVGYDMSNWGDSRFVIYVRLFAGASPEAVTERIRFLQQERWPDSKAELLLQPLARIHLFNPDGSDGAVTYVYIFSVTAALILLIACINFMNLATARSSRRAREIGLRKVVGARRAQIIRQLLGESAVFTLLALAAACLLVVAVLPSFNSLADKALRFAPLSRLDLFLGLAGILVVTGLLSGSYPALYLSSFSPVKVLKFNTTSGSSRGAPLMRRLLVVFQFTLSIALIISTSTVYRQIHYMKNKDLGITADNILCLKINDLTQDYAAIKQEVNRIPGVVNSTATYSPPAFPSIGTGQLDSWDGKQEGERFSMDLALVDYDYLDTFDVPLVAGRKFSREFATDENEAYIVNEAAVRAMGMRDPVGKSMAWNRRPGRIVGVVKDFHLRSLHHEIAPMGILIYRGYNYLCVKIRPEGIASTLDSIRTALDKFRPGQQIDFKFMNEWIGARYRTEERMGRIIRYFTGLAVFISCLGLLGLVSYTAEQRTKEIGIRKVLGASVFSVVKLISREYTLLVAIANLVSWPAAYYIMSRWLQGFAFRTGLAVWVFLGAGCLSLTLALLTVAYQSLKATLANPAVSLRYE